MRIQASLLSLFGTLCFHFTVAEAAVTSECGREDRNCGDGSCLPRASLCNGVPDCPRAEDERYCNFSETSMMSTSDYCNPGEFRCFDGTCITSSWVCDGYKDCREGEDEYNCYYDSTTSDPYPWTSGDPYPWTTRDPDPWCIHPFDMIGEKCILIEPMVDATWYETRYFCQRFDADLVVWESLDFYAELVSFLHQLGLTSRDYWVGATDEEQEGNWYWVNNVKVMNGTPLWALYYDYSSYYQEPKADGSSSQDCGYLDKERFYYMDDEDCTKLKGAICEKTYNKKTSVLDKEEYKRAMLELSEKTRDAIGLPSDIKLSAGNDQDSGDIGDNELDKMKKKANGQRGRRTGAKKTQDAKRDDRSRKESTVEDQDPDKVKHDSKIIENKLDTKPQHIKNIEAVIKNLKAKVFQRRFENMDVLRP